MKTLNKFLLMLAVAFAFGATAANADMCDGENSAFCADNSPIVLIPETKSLF